MKNKFPFLLRFINIKTIISLILLLVFILTFGCSKKDGTAVNLETTDTEIADTEAVDTEIADTGTTDTEEPAPQIVVTYIGSAGFILESQNKKIMIDAPFNSSFISAFEAITGYAEGVESKIANAEAPFNDIDLFLMTHEHEDHLDALCLANVFQKIQMLS